jgi:hypothetical protein
VKKLSTILILSGVLITVTALSFAIYSLDSHYIKKSNKSSQSAVASCQNKGTSHQVVIENNAAVPGHTSAALCDTLTISNEDSRQRLMAFGAHDDHVPYDGVTEKSLNTGQSFTITLNQTGTYYFHDHIGDTAQGDFTVH